MRSVSAHPVANPRAAGYESGMNERPRVLVVDDDDDIRGLVVELLERAGLDVSQADDGRAGLRAFHQSPPDLVLLDVSMPGLDGALTPLEFRLLSAFVRHPRQVLSREQLLELVWGDTYGVSGDQVKLYVGYLRRKLSPVDPDGVPIETLRGF